ncbi:MAG: trypsin-like peptidase domain-containing protein [Verrucomicrobia bacterium]|nr:trypsin-like peptidase domain-containing protein [Verrucomicrobiota bacterium]
MSFSDRSRLILLSGSFLAQLLCASAASAAGAASDLATARDLAHQLNQVYESVYDRVAPAVVVIDVSKADKPGTNENPFEGFDFFFRGPHGDEGDQQPDQSEGSGFFVRPDGYILTNNHVVDGADKIEVKLKDGRSFQAKVVGVDDRTDIAVIKIEAAGVPTVQLANSDEVKVGQLVCAIGAPYKFDYTFTTGVVSAKGRNELLADKYEDYIQTDAAINPGNSGGPLCDIDGNVIGMNTLIHGLNRGLGFAISSNLARQVSDQLITSGHIVRPWLGIIIESLNEQNRGEVFKGIDKGVIVRTIQADTPAAKSDLRPADVITEVDGVSVGSSRELQREVLKKKVGDQVNLGIWRNGRKITVAVRTEELPGETTNRLTTSGPAPSAPPEDPAAAYGLQVQDITPDLVQELGLKSERGIVVTSVTPNSPAAVADIQPGDVITEVGRTAVHDVPSFEKVVADQKGKPNLLLLLDRKGVKTYSIVKSSK